MKTERFCPSLWMGNKNQPRSVTSPGAPASPMDTRHALKVVANVEHIRISAEIDVVRGRVRGRTLDSNLRQSNIAVKRRLG